MKTYSVLFYSPTQPRFFSDPLPVHTEKVTTNTVYPRYSAENTLLSKVIGFIFRVYMVESSYKAIETMPSDPIPRETRYSVVSIH